jgi:hypothetical protein
METKDFSRALAQMKAGLKVKNFWWNGLAKQEMFVAIQEPTETSKMNMPYMYMEVSWEWIPTTTRPRMPSMLDMFSCMREIA